MPFKPRTDHIRLVPLQVQFGIKSLGVVMKKMVKTINSHETNWVNEATGG